VPNYLKADIIRNKWIVQGLWAEDRVWGVSFFTATPEQIEKGKEFLIKHGLREWVEKETYGRKQ